MATKIPLLTLRGGGRCGVVVIGRGHLYQIPPQFLVAPDKRQVDFGHCLLRLAETGDQPAAWFSDWIHATAGSVCNKRPLPFNVTGLSSREV